MKNGKQIEINAFVIPHKRAHIKGKRNLTHKNIEYKIIHLVLAKN